MTDAQKAEREEASRREHFNEWYAEQPMPQLLARIDPPQAAHNAFEEGFRLAASQSAAEVAALRAGLRDLLLAVQLQPSCQAGVVVPCRCVACATDRAIRALAATQPKESTA